MSSASLLLGAGTLNFSTQCCLASTYDPTILDRIDKDRAWPLPPILHQILKQCDSFF